MASVYINEFGSSDNPDWVEIYNSGSSSVDLSLYKLEDLAANTLTLSGTITAGGFATFDWSNRLNNSGDTIKLNLLADNSTVDSVVYGSGGSISAPSAGQSGGRQTDGGSGLVVFTAASKGVTNNSSVPTPSPTSSPTPTPSPGPTNTNTPTPTKVPNTPTPTLTSTSSPTKKPTSTPSSTEDLTVVNDSNPTTPEIILGTQTVGENQPEGEQTEENKNSLSLGKSFTLGKALIAGGFALVGLTFVGLSGYSLLKRRPETSSKNSDTMETHEDS